MDPTANSVNRDDLITRGTILNPSCSRLFVWKTPFWKTTNSPVDAHSDQNILLQTSLSCLLSKPISVPLVVPLKLRVAPIVKSDKSQCEKNETFFSMIVGFLKTTAQASYQKRRCTRCLSRSSASRASWNVRLCPLAMNSLVRTTIAVHLHCYSTRA